MINRLLLCDIVDAFFLRDLKMLNRKVAKAKEYKVSKGDGTKELEFLLKNFENKRVFFQRCSELSSKLEKRRYVNKKPTKCKSCGKENVNLKSGKCSKCRRKVVKCKECGEVKYHRAFGLCSKCYYKLPKREEKNK